MFPTRSSCARVPVYFVLLGLCAASAAAPESDPRSLIADGHWKRARALLEPKVAANPSDAEAAALLSRVRVAFGDFDGAIELAETAVRLNGNMAEYHWVLARACGELARTSSLVKQLGLARRFRREAEAAIALDSTQIQARLYLISYYAGAPGIAGGDKKKAGQLAEDVSRIDAAWGHLARARVVEEAKPATDPQAAAERAALYKKAFEAARAPDVRYEAVVALVNVYLSPSAENFDLAEQYGLAAVKSEPHRAGAYSGLAVAYASRGKWAELDATLAEAETAVPDNLVPYYHAGRAIFLKGSDDARAERCFRKFLTAEPEAGSVTLAHGHWRLGLVLEKRDRRAEAIAEMGRAIQLKPDFDEAKKDLERLRSE